MIRFLFFLILVYLLYKIVKILVTPMFRPKGRNNDPYEPPKEKPGKKKIIPEDEGEYVDFEEMKKDKD